MIDPNENDMLSLALSGITLAQLEELTRLRRLGIKPEPAISESFAEKVQETVADILRRAQERPSTVWDAPLDHMH